MEFKRFSRPKISRNKYNSTTSTSIYYSGGNSSSSSESISYVANAGHASTADYAVSASAAITANMLAYTHTIWGQNFNGTQNVSGALTGVTNLTASGMLTSNSIDTGMAYIDTCDISGDLTVAGDTSLEKTTVNGATYLNSTLDVRGNTKLYTLEVTNSSTLVDLTVNGVSEFNDEATFNDDITSTNINNSDTITTKNLKVTGKAEFWELYIDKIKSVGGAAMFTPADGFTIDYCDNNTDEEWVLYWRAEDGTNTTTNMWNVNDQALCMNFNEAKEGSSSEVSNTYFWALVDYVDTVLEDVYSNGYVDELAGQYDGSGTHAKYHYIRLNLTDYDGTLEPKVGYDIVMCGNRSDKDRQSAIYISAYDGLDTELTAPFYAQYKGINDYSLSSHRKTYFDATSATFIGNFKISDNYDISDLVDDLLADKIGDIQKLVINTYYKYNTVPSDEGAVDTDSDEMLYYGICVTTASTKPSTGYTWQLKSQDTEFYKWVDTGSVYTVKADKQFGLTLKGKLYRYNSTGVTQQMTCPDGYAIGWNSDLATGYHNTRITLSEGEWTLTNSGTYRSGIQEWFGLGLWKATTTDGITEYDLLDESKTYLQTTASAFFEVKQATEDDIASITSRVLNNENGISEVKQTAEDINLSVGYINTGLSNSGIDINTAKITATTNNFSIQTPTGKEVLYTDSDGNLTVEGVIYATDGEFKGTLYTQNGVFGGLVKTQTRVITANNVMDYVYWGETTTPYDFDSGYEPCFGWILDIEKAGSNVIFYSTNDNLSNIPSGYEGYGLISDVLTANTPSSASHYISNTTIYVIFPHRVNQVYFDGWVDYSEYLTDYLGKETNDEYKYYNQAKMYVGNHVSFVNATKPQDIIVNVDGGMKDGSDRGSICDYSEGNIINLNPIYNNEYCATMNIYSKTTDGLYSGIGLETDYFGKSVGSGVNYLAVYGLL